LSGRADEAQIQQRTTDGRQAMKKMKKKTKLKGKAKTSPKRSAVNSLSAKKAGAELPAAQSYKIAAGDASVLIGDKAIKL
jgi:hypothetical protein